VTETLPSGMVTLLFTDNAGSTKLWEHLAQAMLSYLFM
jgi:class 3 adenylate cyclase